MQEPKPTADDMKPRVRIGCKQLGSSLVTFEMKFLRQTPEIHMSISCFLCTSPTHPTSRGILPRGTVQADSESTTEEETALTHLPDRLEGGCVGSVTKNLFAGDLSSPASLCCSVTFQPASMEYGIMLTNGGGTSSSLYLQQAGISLSRGTTGHPR